MIIDQALSLQPFYSDFQVNKRILLSGHSHQAWPNVAKEGILECYQDAATHVDDKWQRAFEKAERVKSFYASLLGDLDAQITLGTSTHELILRYLSDLDCFKSPPNRAIKIVTTDGEFHSMRRQLDRLKELRINIEVVPVQPSETLAQRLIDKIDINTDTVMISAVFFSNSEIFTQVGHVAEHAHALGVPCLVDAYHALNVMPFDLKSKQLEHAFIVSGGYKYCQAGEGNCMLRIPQSHQGRPIITGWFAEFVGLNKEPDKVSYGKGAAAFDGSTYDPTSHYRAAKVFDFFIEQKLTPQVLRKINQQQIAHLLDGIQSRVSLKKHFQLPRHALQNNGGFLALTTEQAPWWVNSLADHGVQCDSRGQQLRLGPAPYVSISQLDKALDVLEVVASTIK